MTQPLATAIFRAGPQHDFVPFDQLSSDERRRAGPSSASPRPYGVVRVNTASHGTEVYVSADLALLFLTLREPGQLPSYFSSALGPMGAATIARLVADGVLEINVAGVFVSGPRGLEALLGVEPGGSVPWETDALSAAALQVAAAGGSTDAAQLAAQLYRYHRIPAGPRWCDQLGSPGDVQRFLGIGEGCAVDFRFAAGWYAWSAPRGAAAHAFKLYVSPLPGALRETVAAVIGRARYRASAMKIGGDVRGLLRPDKFMVYFATFDALAETAQRLRTDLAGTPVHGVPFTATIGGDALLSWGVDAFGEALAPAISWRSWVTMRAAQALAVVNEHPSPDGSVWPFVYQRLALDGIDAKSWLLVGARSGRGALVAP